MKVKVLSNFEVLVRRVSELKPGQSITFSRRELELCRQPIRFYNSAEFDTADWILENIVGSAFEFKYELDLQKLAVTFSRLDKPLEYENTGLMSYVSPDQRQHFTRRPDGLYQLKRS